MGFMHLRYDLSLSVGPFPLRAYNGWAFGFRVIGAKPIPAVYTLFYMGEI